MLDLATSPDENLSHIDRGRLELFGKLRSRESIGIPPLDGLAAVGSKFADTLANGIDRKRLVSLFRFGVTTQQYLGEFRVEDPLPPSCLARLVADNIGGDAPQPLTEIPLLIERIPLAIGGQKGLLGNVVNPIGIDTQ